MISPKVFYSTNTWLAYAISERYYQNIHYVWYSPCFDPRSRFSYNIMNPPSSSPCEIFKNLTEDVNRRDRHSAKIDANRIGIMNGAD